MATIKLNKASIDAIRNYTDKSVSASNALSVVVSQLTKQGVKPEMLKAPEKGADRSLYTSVQEAIKLGFTQEVQELLQKKPATLSDAEKADKRYWQQQVGSKLKDIRQAMTRKTDTGANNQRTPLQIIEAQITDSIERISNLDPETTAIPDAMDLNGASRHLKDALAAFLGK